MTTYRHILAAIDMQDSALEILRKAQALSQAEGAKLTVLHVMTQMPMQVGALGGDMLAGNGNMMAPPLEVNLALEDAARTRTARWCAELGIATDNVDIAFGDVSSGIVDRAEDIGADLIVVGHSPHRGLSALFSHTEASVISQARCDVLAVAVAEPSA